MQKLVSEIDDTLWAYRIAYKMPIGIFQYHLEYRKECNFPMELYYQAYWIVMKLNLDPEIVWKKKMFQFYELCEFHLHAYKNVKLSL